MRTPRLRSRSTTRCKPSTRRCRRRTSCTVPASIATVLIAGWRRRHRHATPHHLTGDRGAVAPGLLGDVHGGVGEVQQRALRFVELELGTEVAGEGGDPDRAGDPAQEERRGLDRPRVRAEHLALDPRPDLLGEVDRRLELDPRQREHELVAAVARGDAELLGHQLGEQPADLAQHLAAGEVTVRVVDVLEEVEVDEENREVGVARGEPGRWRRSARCAGSGRCRGR